jgi:hypothetical protein
MPVLRLEGIDINIIPDNEISDRIEIEPGSYYLILQS